MAEPASSITLPSDYFEINRAISGFLSIIVPLCSTLSGFLTYQFLNYITQVTPGNQRFGTWVGFITLFTSLTGVILQIIIFRSFVLHSLEDDGVFPVQPGCLTVLVIMNYITATFSRIYFARLASTMLRSPRAFLCISGALLLSSLIGLILELVNMNITIREESRMSQIDQISGSAKSLTLHSLLIGAATLWDLMISSVLYRNFFDKTKRNRFGSIDGKISISLMFLFESFGLATFTTFINLMAIIILDFKADMDYGRTSIVYSSLTSFTARVCAVSIFCSFQHKVSDKLRLEQKCIANLKEPDPYDKAKEGGGDQSVCEAPLKNSSGEQWVKFAESIENNFFLNNDEEKIKADRYLTKLDEEYGSPDRIDNNQTGFSVSTCFTDNPTGNLSSENVRSTDFIIDSSSLPSLLATALLHPSFHPQNVLINPASFSTCNQSVNFYQVSQTGRTPGPNINTMTDLEENWERSQKPGKQPSAQSFKSMKKAENYGA